MKQMTFADAEYAGKRKQTRKELFLIEMDRVVPWKGLIALIEPHYPKGEGGRPAYPLMAMLRVHLMQIWLAARRLNQGKFHWPGIHRGAEDELDPEQLQALVLGLPWQRVGAGGAITLL